MDKNTATPRKATIRHARQSPKRAIAIGWLALATLVFILLLSIVAARYITSDVAKGLQQSTSIRNLAVTNAQDYQFITQGVVPEFTWIENLSLAARDYLHEVHLIYIDPDYKPDRLAEKAKRISREIDILDSNQHISLPNDVVVNLRELAQIIQEISAEIVATKNSGDLKQLVVDSEDTNEELRQQINELRLELQKTSQAAFREAQNNAVTSVDNAVELERLLHHLELASQWMLAGLIVLVTLVGGIFYGVIYRRLNSMAHYARRVADGELDTAFVRISEDKFGETARAVADMGSKLSELLAEAREKAELARNAQTEAEQQNWLNESLRQLAEATRGETDLSALGSKTVTLLAQQLAPRTAILYVSEDSVLREIGKYFEPIKNTDTELIPFTGLEKSATTAYTQSG